MEQKQKWWTLLAVVAGVFMLVLDITIVHVALPDIGQDFDSSLSELQWVVDGYLLALAAGLLTGGSLADLWGRRRMYAIGLTVFTLASLLCGLAPSPLFLTLACVAQGIGGAVVWATSLALLGDAFRGRDRGTAFGVYGAALGIAAAMGPLLGGILTSGLGWRWIFLINVPIGLGILVVTLTKVRESKNPAASQPDRLGFVVFSGALGLLIYGLITSAEGWGQPEVYLSLTAAGLLLVTFFVIEQRGARPMLDLTLFRKPTFNGGLIAAFGLSASLYGLFPFLALYLQQQLGHSPVETGVRLLAMTAAMFVTSTVAGRLTSVAPARLMIGFGFVLICAGVWLMGGVSAGSEWTHLLPGMIAAGAGAGMVTVPLASTAVGVVELPRAGMASGANNTARQLGVATSIAVLGSLFTAELRRSAADHLQGTPLAGQAESIASEMDAASGAAHAEVSPAVVEAAQAGFLDGLNLIMAVCAGIALVSAVASFVLIRRRDFVPPPKAPPAPPAGAGAVESAPGTGPAKTSAGAAGEPSPS